MRRKIILVVALCAVLLTEPATTAVTAFAKATLQDDDYVMKVLARGAPLHEANGIWADGGLLYVGTVAGVEIAVLDARTGHVTDRLTRDEGFGCADDVTIGPDGSLYWTDIFEGQVGRRAPDGTVSRLDVAPAMNPIAFDADGRLFVAQSFIPAGDALWEIDPLFRADHPPRLVWDPGDGYPFLQQLNGFDFGPDGLLYSPQPYLGCVVRLDVDAATVVPHVVAEGLPMPTAVKFDSRGRLFAATGAGVMRVDVATGATKLVADIPSGLDNLAFDARDRLYCTGGGNGAVYRVLPSREPRVLSREGMGSPGGIAVVPGASRHEAPALYVADAFSLWRFDARTGRVEDVEWSGAMTMPFTVAPGSGGLILTSWMENRLQLWDASTSSSTAVWDDLPMPLNAVRFQEDLVITTLGTGGQVIRQTPGGGRSVITVGVVCALRSRRHARRALRGRLGQWSRVAAGRRRGTAGGATLRHRRARPAGGSGRGPRRLTARRRGVFEAADQDRPGDGSHEPRGLRPRRRHPGHPHGLPYWTLSGVAVDAAGAIYVTGDKAAWSIGWCASTSASDRPAAALLRWRQRTRGGREGSNPSAAARSTTSDRLPAPSLRRAP